MTKVEVRLTRPAPDGTRLPVRGVSMRWVPTYRRLDDEAGDSITLPLPFTVGLGDDGAAIIDVAPTEAGWTWGVALRVAGRWWDTEHYIVPDVESIDYRSLVRVDSVTLEPEVSLDPLWVTLTQEARDAAIAARTEAQEAADRADAADAASLDTAAVDGAGHLIITRRDLSVIDAGPVVGPSLSVGEILTVTGPAAPGTVGPQGLTGAKGDPGGIILGTLIGATTDLNNLKASGVYRQTDPAYSTLALNYPKASLAGILRVYERQTDVLVQEYEGFTGGQEARVVYRRTFVSTWWSPWRAFNSTRVDQAAGRAIYQWDDLNNREQLIYGDTGWRTIVAWDSAGTVTTGVMPLNMAPQAGLSGAIYIRRMGNSVTLSVHGTVTTAITQEMPIPAGFQPGAPYPALLMHCVASNGVVTAATALIGASTLYWSFPNGALVARGSTTAFGSAVTWNTTQTWPTVLPGIAFGTIPNT